MFVDFIKKNYDTLNVGIIKEDYLNSKDKEYFKPCGTQVFCGRQGMGKTISAVHVLLKLKKRYPCSLVVTNLILNVDFKYIRFSSMDELAWCLTNVNNGKWGVIYIIDEIHTYFNALDSKSIPSYVFTEISQQRKQRKLIIGTSQLYLRMAKPFREQCDTLVMCNTIGGKLTTMAAYDGATLEEDFGKLKGELKRSGFFMQSTALRNSYDTFQKVVSASEQYVEYDAREKKLPKKYKTIS